MVVVYKITLRFLWTIIRAISGSKHDSNQLIVVDNALQWLFDLASAYYTSFISCQMRNKILFPYYLDVAFSMSMISLDLPMIFYV